MFRRRNITLLPFSTERYIWSEPYMQRWQAGTTMDVSIRPKSLKVTVNGTVDLPQTATFYINDLTIDPNVQCAITIQPKLLNSDIHLIFQQGIIIGIDMNHSMYIQM